MEDIIFGLVILIGGALVSTWFFAPPRKLTGQHIELTIGQAWYLLAIKDGMLGPTWSQHHAQARWYNNGWSGYVKLPRLGFEAWEEYYTAQLLVMSKEDAAKLRIELMFDDLDVERIWNDGYDKFYSYT